MSTDHSDWYRYMLFGLLSPTLRGPAPRRSALWVIGSSIAGYRVMRCSACNKNLGVLPDHNEGGGGHSHGFELLEGFYGRARHHCPSLRDSIDTNLRLLLSLTPEQLAALSPEAKRAVVTRWMEDHRL